ncbi:ATP-grasp domain-containing protein [Azospirillum sp. ST 5-10]|uniref:ATP-grasp domain-containing protein n=1 Tax=unclassified Azospirillum TaxID=2630922 RepID=UPI003F49EB4E
MPGPSPAEAGPPGDGGPVIVCALAGRALAAAAVRAGRRPIVVDAFADADTRALAADCRRVAFTGRALARAAARLPPDVPVVYGSGFEGRPERLASLAAGRPLAGNPPDLVRAVRRPETLFPTLARLGIAHPETRRTPPRDRRGWLVKRPGGSGGLHVRPAAPEGGDVCYQRRMPGRPLSVQLLADDGGVRVLAATLGWCAPAPGLPYRFGGLAGPVAAPAGVAEAAAAAVGAFGLRGLCSVDFIATDEAAWLLEINPRPGASLDVLADDPLLFARHLAAFGLAPDPGPLPERRGARAVAVLYARTALAVPPWFAWPAWSADRPCARPSHQGGTVPAGAPLCTVVAEAADAADAARRARRRAARLLSTLEAAAPCRPPSRPEGCHDRHRLS